METTEKIIEAYCRYQKRWFTLPNIRCSGQLEIDILAIDPNEDPIERYHIEAGISISGSFAKLTDHVYSAETLKIRTQQASQRRTLGYFVERKFGDPGVTKKLAEFGFRPGNYKKVIVTWGWGEGVDQKAAAAGVQLWDFGAILREIAAASGHKSEYWTDDTMRTLQLMAKSR